MESKKKQYLIITHADGRKERQELMSGAEFAAIFFAELERLEALEEEV